MSLRPALAALLALALGAVGAVGAGCGGDGDGDSGDGGSSGTPARSQTTKVEVVEAAEGNEGFDPRAIYERESPGVVTVISVFGGGPLDSLLGQGGGSGQGVGSGFVLNGRGEIATNAHVVTQGEAPDFRRAREVYVEFQDRNQVAARIVGFDPQADIALLRIDPAGLTLRALPLGSSEDVEVGEPVVAIGSPFGERNSLSVGVVSAVDRAIESLTNFSISGAIQTDAAINPGNSGGPLVDSAGRVIGINQQIKSRSGGGEGVGFAVPVDTVKASLGQLRKSGDVDYAYIGVSSVELYPQLVERFKLPVERGAWVQTVTPGSPAADAGLRGGDGEATFQARRYLPGGDILTKVDDQAITDADDLSEIIARHRPGDTVKVEAWRGDRRRIVEVELGERPLQAPEQSP